MAAKKKFMETISLGRGVTPKGIASWAFLTTPYTDDSGKSKFRVTMIWHDGDIADLKANLKDWVKQTAKHFGVPTKSVNVSLKTIDDEEAEKINIDSVKSGMRQMEFNTIARGDDAPPIVDTSKDPCKEPWAGDICRVQFNAVGYKTGGNVGVKLYLQGVQVLERNSSGGGKFSTDLFDVEELEFGGDDGDDDLFSDGDNGGDDDLGI